MSFKYTLTPSDTRSMHPIGIYDSILEAFLKQDQVCCIVEIPNSTPRKMYSGLRAAIMRRSLKEKVLCQQRRNEIYLTKISRGKENG